MKHRAPAAAGSAPKLTMKTVRTSLKSLGEISGSLREALSSYQGESEAGEEVPMVALSLPAAKVAELLALLDVQTGGQEEQAAGGDD